MGEKSTGKTVKEGVAASKFRPRSNHKKGSLPLEKRRARGMGRKQQAKKPSSSDLEREPPHPMHKGPL